MIWFKKFLNFCLSKFKLHVIHSFLNYLQQHGEVISKAYNLYSSLFYYKHKHKVRFKTHTHTQTSTAAAVAAKSLQSCPTLCDPIRWQPIRLPSPWDSPGKNTVMDCHVLLQCMKVKSQSEVAKSCPTLSDPMDCSPPGSSIHGIFQARVLKWGAIAFSRDTYKDTYIPCLLNLPPHPTHLG